jgi:predicted phage terminase large subunit-like protein
MDYERISESILKAIARLPADYDAYQDLFSLCRDWASEDHAAAHKTNNLLRGKILAQAENGQESSFYELWRKSLLFEAPDDFDCYLTYLEIDRKASERFYLPRKRIMGKVVQNLQRLADDKLDELFISMPPRVGKTSILMFFTTWLIGRNSEASNLYSAYSDVITAAFYRGVLEILQDPTTYLWRDVFPNAKLVETNAKDETLNIDRRKRYPSLTCRSLYGTLNGACDCNGFEISDDLIGGIEEALNKDRLMSAWSKVDNNLLPRAKEKAKILWCGTRWSMVDPAGIRMELLQNDEKFRNRRFEIMNLPALDENDESQFCYEYGVGFSTEYYRQRRASFERNNDMASWTAQYMGQPIERDGALFSPADFRYYNGTLPDGEPDRIFMAVDPAFGGGDFVAAPVCYQYGNDIYVHDVVYDDGDKRVTQPLLVSAIMKHNVQAAQFEATKATMDYKEGVEEQLKAKGYRLNITTKAAPTDKAKFQRIFDKAPDIRENMVFLESGKRSKAYSLFMQNVFSYTMFKKTAHDDAPDSLTMAMNMVRSLDGNRISVFARPF